MLIAGCALLLVVTSRLGRLFQERPVSNSQPSTGAWSLPATGPSHDPPAMDPDLQTLLDGVRGATAQPRRDEVLASLRTTLRQVPRDDAARFIIGFIASGEDASTGQSFALGPDGHLDAAPTLRTFLLDQLGRIDAAAAARVAESILAVETHPDEWALAMKYYAQGGDTGQVRAFLQSKIRQMWANESWAAQPSVGYLEAFDVAVHLGGTELVPDLAAMVRDKERRAAGHAAYLALDRMVIRDPGATLAMLDQSPDLLAGREQTRANYFARADVRDPGQRQILEQYLLDAARSAGELEAFAGIFPNANHMVSHNLLTPVITPDGGELATRDQGALDTVKAWQADGRFSHLGPHLEAMRNRLEQFVRQHRAR